MTCKCNECPIKWLLLIVVIWLFLLYAKSVYAQCFDGYGYQVSCWSGWSGLVTSRWGSSQLQRDYCPSGDLTLSYYDWLCDENEVLQDLEVDSSESRTMLVATSIQQIVQDDEVSIIQELKKAANLHRVTSVIIPEFTLPAELPQTGSSHKNSL